MIKWFDRWEDGFATGDLNNDDIADVVLGTSSGDVVAVNSNSGEALGTYSIANTGESVNADIVDVDGATVRSILWQGKINEW